MKKIKSLFTYLYKTHGDVKKRQSVYYRMRIAHAIPSDQAALPFDVFYMLVSKN